jgi:DNA-binding transcriptional LysR family regulator
MRSLLNQVAGLIAFVRVVEAQSFSAAARNAGTTPSAISKSIGRLEAELGAKLFRRSTRTLSLTPDGQAFFDRIAPVLRGLEDAADAVRSKGEVRGRLRVSMPSELGRLFMTSITSEFLATHAELELDLALADHHVDVIREGYDVVIRAGSPVESDLRTRTLAQLDMVLVASPEFLLRRGNPDSIDELRALPFVRYLLEGRSSPVRFMDGTIVVPQGRVAMDSGFGLRAAALDGMGIAYLMNAPCRRISTEAT